MPTLSVRARSRSFPLIGVVVAALLMTACGDDRDSSAGASGTPTRTLKISSIPDQDQDKLAARDGAMAKYLTVALGVKVEYVPVTDYAASVNLFKTGDLDMVFFGGLTGVQARLRTPGSVLIAQRDIDDGFRSVFIANADAAIAPVDSVQGLSVLRGKRFTFGSESSTSGRLMPQYFLDRAGVSAADFAGAPGYSGSHDKTIDLVQSGSYQAGVVNSQVWDTRKAKRTVDLDKVVEVFTTPSYHDYHWLAGPKTDRRFGAGFTDKVRTAMLALDHGKPADAGVLDGYGAKAFIATKESNYAEIESIGRKLRLVS
jgi:phosphonate transport system substrate-binding protein